MRDETQRDESFFIGWEAQGPSSVMAFVKRRVWAILALAAAVGAVVTALQPSFASSNFEFGVERTFEGVLEHHPFPVLRVERPGGDGDASRWLLTVFGKRGAESATLALDGHRIRVKGSLIYRDRQTMVEILPGSLEDLGAAQGAPSLTEAEPVRLRGEIVDSKCFLGVMKPGNLKTHRACAARCISGGVPPVLLVRDEDGMATYFLLVGSRGEAINASVLPFVAELVEVEGEVQAVGELRILRTDPAAIRRI
ncbi:MAG: hypothetical protein AAGG01_15215 [Planctomycetota bacterium]